MRRTSVLPPALTVASMLLLAATLVGGGFGNAAFVLTAPLFPVLLMLLAMPRRHGRASIERRGLVVLGAVLTCTSVAIWWAERSVEVSWLFGVPTTLLLMAVGLVAVPLVLVGGLFAIGFRDVDAAGSKRSNPSAGSCGRKS